MKILSELLFLCLAVSVERCLAQGENCDCTVYYLCEEANTVPSTKCTSPEVCCRPAGPTNSPLVTAPTPRTSSPVGNNPTEADRGQGANDNCDCVPAAECPEVSGAGQLDIRFGGKKCGKNEVCCQRAGVSGGDGGTGGGGEGGEPQQPTTPDPSGDQFQECGFRRSLANRISGNSEQTETSFGEFPWMMAVLTTRTNKDGSRTENVFNCGATLILPHVVMTAAHCVNNIPVADIKVRGGEWDTVSNNVSDREPFPYQERTVSQIYIHQDFEASTVYNDIALIILDFPFPVKDHIGLICTPNSVEEYDENKCIVTGWGKDKFGVEGRYQSTLKKLDLKIVPRNKCQEKLRKTRLGGKFKLHESFMCAAGEEGQDACKGDGGGPLICQLKREKDRYTQVGIVAWGIGCNTDTPGVYVDVIKYKKWILDNSHGTVIDTRIRKKN